MTRRAQLLDALLDSTADSTAISRVAVLAAQAWSLPEKGRYAVVVRQAASSAALAQPPPMPPTAGRIRVLWRPRPDCQLGIAVLGGTDAPAFADALPATPGWRTGVSHPVNGLAGLSRARRLAEAAVGAATAEHAVACAQREIATTLVASCPDLAGELSGHALAPLLELNQAHREVLLDTFAAWLAAGGSVRHAATPLYCHRNTVLNRLRRLEELTGRSLSTPKDLVELVLAVEAFRRAPDVAATAQQPLRRRRQSVGEAAKASGGAA